MNLTNNANIETENIRTAIKGMHCASCSSRIEKVIGSMDGVSQVSVNLATEQIDLSWDNTLVPLEAIAERIAGLGFELILPKGEDEIHFAIGGMHCASCSSRIEKVIGELEGVASCQVNLATGEAKIIIDPARVTQRELREAIEKLGFQANSVSTSVEFAASATPGKSSMQAHAHKRIEQAGFIISLSP